MTHVKIQIPGYLVDLFTVKGRPRKVFQLGLIGFKMLWKWNHNKITITILSSVVITSGDSGQVRFVSTTWAELASVPD